MELSVPVILKWIFKHCIFADLIDLSPYIYSCIFISLYKKEDRLENQIDMFHTVNKLWNIWFFFFFFFFFSPNCSILWDFIPLYIFILKCIIKCFKIKIFLNFILFKCFILVLENTRQCVAYLLNLFSCV